MTKIIPSLRAAMIVAIIIVASFFLSCHKAYGQTNLTVGENGMFTGNITNAAGDSFTTFSNGFFVSKTSLQPSLPPLTTTNGVVIPDALLAYVSANTGIPVEILKTIPLKYLILAAFLYFGLPTIARDLRKFLPDGWQVNKFGLVLAQLAREVNPSIAKLSQAAASPTAVPMEQPAAAVPIPPPAQSLTPPPNAPTAAQPPKAL
jgi:hypothetical protein